MAMTSQEIVRLFNKMVEPLWRTVQLMASRCLLDSVDDDKSIQVIKVQLLADESDEVERFQNFGFSSVPLTLSEGIVLAIGGAREHLVALAVDSSDTRPTGSNPGSSVQYDAVGSKMECDGQGGTNVECTVKHEIKAPFVDIGSGGSKEFALNGLTFQTGYNLHTHTVFGIPTTPVNTPSPPTDLSTAVQIAKTP